MMSASLPDKEFRLASGGNHSFGHQAGIFLHLLSRLFISNKIKNPLEERGKVDSVHRYIITYTELRNGGNRVKNQRPEETQKCSQ